MRALASSLCVISLLAGCASTALTPPEPYAAPKPVARTTPYTKPLACLGDLYGTYSSNPAPLLVSVMPANDVTGASQFTSAEVPREFTLMVEAAVNSVSPRIRLINVDHEFQVRENAVGGRFQRVAPKLLLKPAISEFDRGLAIMSGKRDLSGFFGKGKGATDFSVDRGLEEATARIGVDMMAYEYGTMSSVPNVHASVGAEVGRKGVNQGWSLSIYGWGVGNTTSTKSIQARHEAVRVLTEYAVLQTLGRYLRLPYWRCVEGMEEDPVLKQSLSSYHQKLDEKSRVASLQELLQYHGFEIEKSGVVDEHTKQALSTLKTTNPEAVKNKTLADLYYQLYVSIPVGNVPDAPGWRLVMPLRAAPPQKQDAAAAPAPMETAKAAPGADAKAKAPAAAQPAISLSMQPGPLKRGAPVQLQIATAAPLFVYCFLQEANGNIQMFFPNRFARSAKLAPGQSVRLPGSMGFTLTAHAEGKREDIVCFGSKADIAASLPNKGRDFEPVKVASLQELGQIVARANNGSVEAAALAVQGQ
ncbi:MAG: DUF4384 domain-containing protein [Burkholderiaceae bacterium]